eukprot:m.347710 g.347710  ORF g.347710 m.347710 type:complete len:254 (-) comp20672_c1_seq1:274-1035(-)
MTLVVRVHHLHWIVVDIIRSHVFTRIYYDALRYPTYKTASSCSKLFIWVYAAGVAVPGRSSKVPGLAQVCAFAGGYYAVTAGNNEPCLVYVTLQEPETNECSVVILYDLGIRSVAAQRLRRYTLPPAVTDNLEELARVGVHFDDTDDAVSGGTTSCTVNAFCKILEAEPALRRFADTAGAAHKSADTDRTARKSADITDGICIPSNPVMTAAPAEDAHQQHVGNDSEIDRCQSAQTTTSVDVHDMHSSLPPPL